MNIPDQNAFLVPFLRSLSTGEAKTRAQLIADLLKHFGLPQSAMQEMSGKQRTIVNRMAWCDSYFGKAGFISKSKHPHDSLLDEFRITSVGQTQLRQHEARISVGYLQSFYRGKVLRGSGSDDSDSEAELALYELFEKLPEAFTVIHSVNWIAHDTRDGTVGEADFLIAHRDYGVLVLEVKGGEVWMERRGNRTEWYSRSRTGAVHNIGDPCSQAERNRRNLHTWLSQSRVTRKHAYAIFPAIALPDSVVTEDIRPDCTVHMLLDKHACDDAKTVERQLLAIFKYWQEHADAKNQQFGGQAALDAMIDLVVPTRKLTPRIGDIFERERRKIEELTQQQFRVLRQLRRHHRAAIVGGAGTGKTMLAMEKAQQLTDDGLRVLFLCFNRNIVDWLGKRLTDDNITVATYHSYVGQLQQTTGLNQNRGLQWEDFIEAAPQMLLDAASVVRQRDPDALFDAIIVDEAQDFDEAMWIPLPDLLKDPDDGIFYVFFDDNQRLYNQIKNIPMDTPPFDLVDNCRNTQSIHTAMIPYAVADSESYCDGPEGRPIEVIPVDGKKTAHKEIQRVLHRLVNDEGVKPEDIIILTPSAEKRSIWKNDTMLGNFVLTWNMQTDMHMAVRVCTIYSFKGLESAVVILTELDKLYPDVAQQLMYVGLSRARNHVVVLGELPGLKS